MSITRLLLYIYKVIMESLSASQNWDLLELPWLKASSWRTPVDNRLNFKHVISPITFTALTGLLIKLSMYLNDFLDQSPSTLEKLRLAAMVPSEASTIQETKGCKSFSTFCQIAKLRNFAHTGPANIVYHS